MTEYELHCNEALESLKRMPGTSTKDAATGQVHALLAIAAVLKELAKK